MVVVPLLTYHTTNIPCQSSLCHVNNYIVRSYRDVIVITKFAITKDAISTGYSHVLKQKTY